MIGSRTAFILYTLGKFYSLYDKKIRADLLEIAVSKKIFIDIIRKASITKLSERMVYRHLEMMEKQKLISYTHQKIMFTPKGRKRFMKTRKQFEDYFCLGKIMHYKDISKLSQRSQTYFLKKKKK